MDKLKIFHFIHKSGQILGSIRNDSKDYKRYDLIHKLKIGGVVEYNDTYNGHYGHIKRVL